MDLVKLWTILSTNGIILDEPMRNNISRFAKELKYWNSNVNLISRKDEDNILEKHILHSLAILMFIDPRTKARVLDIGTGGGLPGIPIKIVRPDLFMHLIDSITKKVKITDMLASHTGLKNIRAVKSRAEEYHSKIDFKFDLIIARAVAPASKLFHWSKELIKTDTKFAFLKGGDLKEELAELENEAKGYKIQMKDLEMIGYDNFKRDEKKIILMEKK